MRYYNFTLNTNTEQIKETAKINLREFAYYNPICALNNYLYQNLKNGLCFLGYREDGDTIKAIFAFNERIYTFQNAYNSIMEMLNEVFSLKSVKENPYEITIHQFVECLNEARRRDYGERSHRFAEAANLWFYNYYVDESKQLPYKFQEKIISQNNKKENLMYDQTFMKELLNIEAHKNISEYNGNMVHYIISGRSIEAVSDLTEALMQRLADANRITGRRMDIISEIEPNLYAVDNKLENIIENNYGGAIVFDLSEKFGCHPTEYQMTCQYIEKLIKKYRNVCLFVFTYNMEKPGFSYYILPNIKKYVMPVMLREGTGNRKAAVSYMEELIRHSEYSKYADQAEEFMQLFPEKQFSQTDVLVAYEKFESWCLHKNILKGYDYDFSDNFMLDRDENVEDSYAKLNKMIGLEKVKKHIHTIIAANAVEKERKRRKGNDYHSGTMHMIFGGNPGTAKSTVGRLFAGIAKERGVLKSGVFVERGGMDLNGLFCVQAIREAFLAAKGGVLFIDEAYSLTGDTAVTALIQEMENRRDDVIVILAGYNERMEGFLQINEGLKSRIPYWVDFPDYNTEELTNMFQVMVQERGFTVTEDAIKESSYIFDKARTTENFGNGRFVRNLLDQAIQKQSVRLLSDQENVDQISKEELFLLTKEDIASLEETKASERVPGSAKKEFEEMIGLSSVKSVIRKAIAGFKMKKICMDKGLVKEKASLHMVFTGNPGTAKTTVARLFAQIMKDENLLPTGKFVEVGRADLVGKYVGSTAPLVKQKFKEAQGGVLFIDEAYSLCDNYQNGFGDEAINTFVQEMENHRDNVIVIFAGYPEPMKQFLERNPGLLSRIAFRVNFEDYSVDELCDITRLMLERKQLSITDDAMMKLRRNYEIAREYSDYGNGRYVRKILEEAEMNLAERISQFDESEITISMLTIIEETDIADMDEKLESKPESKKQKIGFCMD